MNRQEIENYYYFGILEKEVGYNKDDKINILQLKLFILNENLDKYSNIEFNPKIETISNMVALIEENNSFVILTTGEKGSGVKISFNDKGLALNYMLSTLRLRKKNIIEQKKSEEKKTL